MDFVTLKWAGRGAVVAFALALCGCSSNSQDAYFNSIQSQANVFVSPEPAAISKVAIMPFKGPTELIGSSVSDMFVTEMLRAGRYELVERGQMSKVLNESEIALSGLSVSKAAEVGNMLGADGVIIGTVDEYSTVAYRGYSYPVVGITVRLIDCKSGKVMWSVDLAKRADSQDVTLPQHARIVVHEMTAGLYQKWDVQRTVPREEISGRESTGSGREPVGMAQAPASETPPEPPEGLAVTDMGLRSATVSWGEPRAGVSRYVIQRSRAAGGPFTEIDRVSAGRKSFEDRGSRSEPLQDATTYYYRLIAVSASGMESQPCQAKETMTAPPPDPPVNVRAVPHGSRAVQVTWDASPSEGVEEYIVERADADAPANFQKRTQTPKMLYHEGETPESDIKDSTKYLYRVTAINRVRSIGQPSAPVEVTTEPPPAKVTGLTAAGDQVRCVPLSWNPNPEDNIVRYDIYRSETADGTFQKICSVKGRENTKYLDGDRDPGSLLDKQAFLYRVRAINAVTAESEDSDAVGATTRPPPPAVEGVAAEFDRPREVPVSWKESPDEKVIGYEILRGDKSGENLVSLGTVNGRETTRFVDRGGARPSAPLGKLSDGTEYSFEVMAFNTANAKSPPSKPVIARTKLAPQAPIGLSASTNAPKAVNVTWSPNAEPDIREYVVEAAAGGSSRFRECVRVASGEGTQVVAASESKLGDGEKRVYRIKAIDKDGLESTCSDPVEGVTKPLPDAPGNPVAQLNDSGARISWTAPPQPDIRDYKIWKKGFITADVLTTTTATGYQLGSVEIGKKIVIQVSAVDQDGLESARSDPVEIRPPAPATSP